MKILDGKELAGYITERQARQVRGLRQHWGVKPRLAIITTTDNPVTSVYIRLKQRYGEDILVDVDVHRVDQRDATSIIDKLNKDATVQGIIVQLPLSNIDETDEIVAKIAPEKDVDGLGPQAGYVSATATAINWLLAGYNIELQGRNIAIVGLGRLVGSPLLKLWKDAGLTVQGYDDTTDNLGEKLRLADVIVTATGSPRLIQSHMVKPGAVIVDAGTASENGELVGDVAPELRERNDITITPIRGGVGPLTVVALFDNVIQAARASASDEAKY